ncbi:hypothetical protein [Kocuria kalidii]|uniref:hypothetical protein n=1 Tax=Kocuria kalidii TaxID=3376283 RepID=UPI00379D6196
MDVINHLVSLRRHRWAQQLLALQCVEIPAHVKIGDGFRLLHRGFGTVVHPDTVIGDNVTVFHGVTLGRADAWKPKVDSLMEGIEIGDEAVLCAGAKILCKDGILRVGRGTVVAANAVLTQSTGEDEVWAGIPARKVAHRA